MIAFFQRSWFGLSLLALMLAGIPGIALFGASLFGYEGPANDFLQSHFKLGYHLPISALAAAVLFAVPFLLVLLYFLKLKRKSIQVPSTFLWKKSVEDLRVNSLFQWLRQNALLLLQLLAVLAMIYAILGPRIHGRTSEGKHYILMIDNSASMGATDVGPNRLEVAKLEAIKEIDAASDSDIGMVIVFNSSAEIRQSFTTNRFLLRQSIRDVQPTQRPTRIEEALALADSLANPSRSTEDVAARPANPEPGKERTYVQNEGTQTEVHLFSDGRFPDVPNFALGQLYVQLHPIGTPGAANCDNVGIVNFNAVRDENELGRLTVFARVLSFRPQATPLEVALDVKIDGKLDKLLSKKLTVPARKYSESETNGVKQSTDIPGESTLTFELNDIDDRAEVQLHAKLVNHKDSLPVDDDAYLVVGVVRRARVLLAGPSNPVLKAFFEDESTQIVCDVKQIDAADLADATRYIQPARAGQYDLVIFDRCAPAREDEMPLSNTLFIGAPPPPWSMPGKPGKAVEKVENPGIKGWTTQHGLLKYLTGLHELGIAEAFRMPDLPPRTPRLMEGDRDLPLMLALNRGAYTDAVVCFPLIGNDGAWNTNWPLVPSFPLFLRNALYTLGNIRDAASEENTQPGQVKTLRPDATVPVLTVTDPRNGSATVERGQRPDFAFGGTEFVGVYRANWDGGLRRFAVNLLDADESNIEPRPAVTIGAVQVNASPTRQQPRELWKWAVLAGFVFLLLEWYIYNKRVFI